MLMKNQADKILPGGKKFSGKDKTFQGYNLYIMNESTMCAGIGMQFSKYFIIRNIVILEIIKKVINEMLW